MEALKTNQERNEEIKWTVRERQLAKKYGVEPEMVGLVTEIVAEQFKQSQPTGDNAEAERQIARQFGIKSGEVRFMGDFCSWLFKRMLTEKGNEKRGEI